MLTWSCDGMQCGHVIDLTLSQWQWLTLCFVQLILKVHVLLEGQLIILINIMPLRTYMDVSLLGKGE